MIFLIEDNKADVELFRIALGDGCVDCDIMAFQDGSEMLDYIRNSDPALPGCVPDLMVLDLNLPKIDGLELLQVIREVPVFRTVPVVVLSSSSSARERSKLANFNIRQFIVKPPDLDEYLKVGKMIRDLLDESKSLPDGPPRALST